APVGVPGQIQRDAVLQLGLQGVPVARAEQGLLPGVDVGEQVPRQAVLGQLVVGQRQPVPPPQPERVVGPHPTGPLPPPRAPPRWAGASPGRAAGGGPGGGGGRSRSTAADRVSGLAGPRVRWYPACSARRPRSVRAPSPAAGRSCASTGTRIASASRPSAA